MITCGVESTAIYDKQGRKYELRVVLDEYPCLVIRIYRWGSCVGLANCLFQSPNDMLLADVRFEECMAEQRRPLERIRACLLREPSNYQRLGLGTITLKFIIDRAK